LIEFKNSSAFHTYHIEDTYVAGMVLAGTEVKSIREGKVSFADAYCFFLKGELWLKGLHIAEYRLGTSNNHMVVHDRKLLLNRKELRKLEAKTKEKGFTIVPLRIFFNEKSIAKMEIGIGRGKKLHDKRETIKAREIEREIKRHLK